MPFVLSGIVLDGVPSFPDLEETLAEYPSRENDQPSVDFSGHIANQNDPWGRSATSILIVLEVP